MLITLLPYYLITIGGMVEMRVYISLNAYYLIIVYLFKCLLTYYYWWYGIAVCVYLFKCLLPYFCGRLAVRMIVS